MEIQSLELEHFRNFQSLKFDFSKNPILALVGQNAQGKTNFLEAVAFLALGKSFRTGRSMDVIAWNQNHTRIRGKVEGKSLEVFLQKNPEKKVLKFQGKIRKPAHFLGHLKVVLFTPDHLSLVTSGPAFRRQFIDRLLVQLSSEYVEALSTYQKILKHRNTLLKTVSQGKSELWELELWDLRLLTESQLLLSHRKKMMKFFGDHLKEIYKHLAGTNDELTLLPKLYENLEKELESRRRFDLMTGSTSAGPHREDFTLLLNGKPLADIGSQGEKRTAVLALKIAEIHFIEQESGQKPLLLLDDVLSELDDARRKHLTIHLKNHQTILTTTSAADLSHFEHITQIHIKSGQVS